MLGLNICTSEKGRKDKKYFLFLTPPASGPKFALHLCLQDDFCDSGCPTLYWSPLIATTIPTMPVSELTENRAPKQ